jgi:hypothetical protein
LGQGLDILGDFSVFLWLWYVIFKTWEFKFFLAKTLLLCSWYTQIISVLKWTRLFLEQYFGLSSSGLRPILYFQERTFTLLSTGWLLRTWNILYFAMETFLLQNLTRDYNPGILLEQILIEAQFQEMTPIKGLPYKSFCFY